MEEENEQHSEEELNSGTNDEDQGEPDEENQTGQAELDEENDNPIGNWVIFTLISIIYIALMMITGVMVYASYGWKGQGSNGTLSSQVTGVIQNMANQIGGANPTMRPDVVTTTTLHPMIMNTDITANKNITGICPFADGTCPQIDLNNCVENLVDCVPQRKPTCFPHIWPTRHACPDLTLANCPDRSRDSAFWECPIPRIQAPIEKFRKSMIFNIPAFDLLNMYPPNSPNRLEVVTTLIKLMIEPLVRLGFFHPCTGNSLETTCSFCNDRYEYIRCVMSNTLQAPLNSSRTVLKPFLDDVGDKGESELDIIRVDIVNTVMRTWAVEDLGYIFLRIEEIIDTLSVKTMVPYGDMSQCRICKDFNRNIYNRKCFYQNKVYTGSTRS